MNRVELIGRLTAKPELRYTNSNKAVSRFGIAVNRIGEGVDFINALAWEKQAENIANYLDKGSLVGVEGSIQTGTYEDKDGNKRTSFEVIAHRVEFLESKKSTQENTQEETTEDPYAEYGKMVDINDSFLD